MSILIDIAYICSLYEIQTSFRELVAYFMLERWTYLV